MNLDTKLRKALHSLDELNEIFIHSVQFYEDIKSWVMYFSTNVDNLSMIEKSLNWYCLIDHNYPIGAIEIRPCRIQGLKTTFQHQSHNKILNNKPWTSGKLCLDYAFDLKSPFILKVEPKDSDNRLCWHFKRLIEWIKNADSNSLIKDGEPYELPDYNISTLNTWGYVGSLKEINVFNEKNISLGLFQYIPTGSKFFNIITRFTSFSGAEIFNIETTEAIKDNQKNGIWVLLDKEVVVEDWHTPQSYDELVAFLLKNSIDFYSILKKIIKFKKNKKLVNSIALGWPIPEFQGEPAIAIHWQVFEFPQISVKADGFRDNTESLARYNKFKFFNRKKISWSKSANINPDYLFSRIPEFSTLRQLNICIVGLGSFGSTFAESLIRSGIHRLTLIDFDIFQEGNLCRHILTTDDIGVPKVIAIEERLKKINPFLEIKTINKALDSGFDFSIFNEFNAVIDFTADDSTIQCIEKSKAFLNHIPFFSFSFGVNVNPILCYYSSLKDVSFDFFQDNIEKHKEVFDENNSYANEKIGCWSPIFPGTHFSIQNASHISFQYFFQYLGKKQDANVSIYKSVFEEGVFLGVQKI